MRNTVIWHECCNTHFEADTAAEAAEAHVRYHNGQFARGRRNYAIGHESDSPVTHAGRQIGQDGQSA